MVSGRFMLALRMFYRRHLARYPIFRLMKRAVLGIFWRIYNWRVYRIYAWMAWPFRVRTYNLVRTSDLMSGRQEYPRKMVESATRVDIPGPRFVGHYPIELDSSPVVSLDMPKVEVIELREATVVGGTNFSLLGETAVHPDLFVPSRDVCPAEQFGVASIDPGTGKLRLGVSRKARNIDCAVSLLGQCTGNYAHWLTETLPKLPIVDACPGYEDLPLLIEDWSHPVFRDSISLLNTNHRQIIAIKRWQPLFVSRLVDISPPAYVPAELRSFVKTKELSATGPELFPFSRRSLQRLRDAAWSAVPRTTSFAPRRLYLRRVRESSGNQRSILNIDAVERLILSSGFTAVDPATLSFAEQVSLFQGAEVIIAPIGAALANAIFSPMGCKVVVLSPYYQNANYYYFSNLMGVLGHHLHFVLGPQSESESGHPLHRDYFVELDALAEALERLRDNVTDSPASMLTGVC